MPVHFCQIRTRDAQTVLAEFEVEAVDWYYARHKAADLFRKSPEYPSLISKHGGESWFVDSIEVADDLRRDCESR